MSIKTIICISLPNFTSAATVLSFQSKGTNALRFVKSPQFDDEKKEN